MKKHLTTLLVIVLVAVGVYFFFFYGKKKALKKGAKTNNIPNGHGVTYPPAGTGGIKPSRTPENTGHPLKEQIYVVKDGDTLGKIAQKFKTTVSVLAKKNHIKNVNLLKIGQHIVI